MAGMNWGFLDKLGVTARAGEEWMARHPRGAAKAMTRATAKTIKKTGSADIEMAKKIAASTRARKNMMKIGGMSMGAAGLMKSRRGNSYNPTRTAQGSGRHA